LIDFHSHLVPGADDGAADRDEARAALAALATQGVHTAIVTPHLRGSVTERPDALRARMDEMDALWEELRALAAAEFPALRLERGAEVMLDSAAPLFADPRTRLAATPFVLVEFPRMMVPAHAEQILAHVLGSGWTPVVAHPERYGNLHAELRDAEAWRRMGAHLQVNAGSLLGRYGADAQGRAWRLVRLGWADYLSSDYHARGRLALAGARDALASRGGHEQAALLLETNAARLLAGEPPLPVPPLAPPAPLWKRLLGIGAP
jgi:protein-tyrosine phosphatase